MFVSARSTTLLLIGALMLALGPTSVPVAAANVAPDVAPNAAYRVLVFSRTAGFRHASIPAGVEAIRALGREHGFAVDATEDPARFADDALSRYAAVVFLSTTGDVLDETQQEAFERYIRRGGGYVGIHAASDTEYEWPWYGRLVGAYFAGHPRVQDATIVVTDRRHPSTEHLPERWQRADEWYDYGANPRGKVHVLAALDERTYEGGGMGHDHPIAWCHLFDGGRAWYTGGGHTAESFGEPAFVAHLLGGIRWAAGVVEGDAGATVDAHFDKVVLDADVSDPMELAVAPDGRVVFVERGGIVKIWKPDTRSTVTAGFINVFTELEDGLLGVALDPDFATNGWIYLCYAPAGEEPKNVVSRWTLSGDELDATSEVVLLEIGTQRDECCHSGGSLAFDRDGNLFISTGDNTSPFASDGFAPIDERDGRAPFDAQKSSASTDDLRGKVLRITPATAASPAGHAYTIPPGNLFPPDGSLGRPEIYAMGCRNPFRISVDPRTGTLYWGDVGPDAGTARDDRGPAGHDEFNRAQRPGNFGWPYFTGANHAYNDYDFDTKSSGPLFDPASPRNDSPNRNGRRELPPAQPAWISYTYGETPAFPELGAGGRCAMAGPVYYDDAGRPGARMLPPSYDGAVFIYEWARNWIKTVRFDASGGILAITPFLDGMTFTRPMDLELGPDGCLYLIEWGTGFGGGNPDALVSRIEYFPTGDRPPRAVAAADVTSGPLPLTVSFSSAGSRSRAPREGLTFAWDLDDDGVVDAREPAVTFTYTSPGRRVGRLTVTDANGVSAVSSVAITAGNTAPHVALDWPPDGGIHAFGDEVAFRVAPEDAEDAVFEADRVLVQTYLGHDTHAHPLRQQHEITGRFVSLPDAGHGADADLFTVLSATYTDLGGAGAPALRARAEVILQPKRKQAEHASSSAGVRIEKADDPAGGGQAVVFTEPTAHVSFAPINLHGIHAATLRVAAGADGGTLDLRVGAADGVRLARAVIEPAAMLELAAGLHPIRVEFFEAGGGAGLILRMREEGGSWRVVPDASLRREDAIDAAAGLRAAYYDLEDASRLPDFGALEPRTRASVDRLDFPSTSGVFAGSELADNVGAVFSGFLLVPVDARYTFSLESDDGSRLFIDDELVIDNDGLHGMVEKSADVRWTDVTVALDDPGGTHELFVVATTGDAHRSPVKLNWIEFQGAGVASAPAGALAEPPLRDHDHTVAGAPGGIPLFDGATLDGWRVVGGNATYRVDDGCIVGAVGPGPNTFLRTERTFADFELTLQVKLDVPGNSGIQFRSHQREDGRVYGYQCEIDPSERAWSGGIYDEGRRGWLASLEADERARAAFRVEGWNDYRIRAEGSRLRTWVNGVPCADLEDDADAEGFIALQVHSGERGVIRWRNVRLRELGKQQ